MGLQKLFPFSQEQKLFLTRSTARINVCDGPVRAGKNFVANLRFKNYLKLEPYEDRLSDIAFCGVTKESVYRNFLRDLFRIVGEKNYTYKRQLGRGTIFGREFYVFSFKDADDFKALQGATLGGAYMTETVHCHPDFFKELLARCSVGGARIFCDCNPASPQHWFYLEFLTNEKLLATGILKRFRFNFDSNLSLTEEFKDSLKELYVPGSLRYKRMIEGQWVAADGVIYTSFNYERNTLEPSEIPNLDTLWLPFDFGIQHPTIFGQLGKHNGKFYLADCYRHNGEIEGRQTNGEYVLDMRDFLAGNPKRKMLGFPHRPQSLILDPAPVSAAFNVELGREFSDIAQELANNEVLEGIGTVQRMLENKDFFVSRKCLDVIRGFGGYIWDKKASERTGNDVPLKVGDDEMCMVRYGLHTLNEGYDPFAGYGEPWMVA